MAHHARWKEWVGAHQDYLHDHIFLPVSPLPTIIDRQDEDSCPETFRYREALQTFGFADSKLELIRVERAFDITREAGLPVEDLLAVVRDVLANPTSASKVLALEDYLEQCNEKRQARPTWTAFWEDVHDLFGDTPAKDAPTWPDELRDRLGLYHYNPDARLRDRIAILLFRYPTGALPPMKGERDLHPLAVPSVLDGRFSQAFCPAPDRQPTGYAVHLGQEPPRRELMHPAIPLQARHLFRVGAVTGSVPADLTIPRRVHLTWLCQETGRPDYAQNTDGDIL